MVADTYGHVLRWKGAVSGLRKKTRSSFTGTYGKPHLCIQPDSVFFFIDYLIDSWLLCRAAEHGNVEALVMLAVAHLYSEGGTCVQLAPALAVVIGATMVAHRNHRNDILCAHVASLIV